MYIHADGCNVSCTCTYVRIRLLGCLSIKFNFLETLKINLNVCIHMYMYFISICTQDYTKHTQINRVKNSSVCAWGRDPRVNLGTFLCYHNYTSTCIYL